MLEPISNTFTIIGSLLGITKLVSNRFNKNEMPKKNETLEAKKTEARADAAKALIDPIQKIQEAMSEIRCPLFDEYFKDKLDYAKYRQNKIEERIAKHDNLFNALHDAQNNAKIFIGDKSVDKSVKVLFDVLNSVRDASEKLVRYARLETTDLKLIQDSEQIMCENRDKPDKISKAIKKAIKKIETNLIPIIRMETQTEQKSKRAKT